MKNIHKSRDLVDDGMFSVSVSFNSHVACLGAEIHWDTQLGKCTNSGVPYTLTNSAYNRVFSLDFLGVFVMV